MKYIVKELHHPKVGWVHSLNDHGDACGWGGNDGVVWYASGSTAVINETVFYGINNVGLVVGQEYPGTPKNRAIYLHGSARGIVSPPPSTALCVSQPTAGYPEGVVGGGTYGPDGLVIPFAYFPGSSPSISNLSIPPNFWFEPCGINTNNNWCGEGTDGNNAIGYFATGGNWIQLAQSTNSITGLNSLETVVGFVGNVDPGIQFTPAYWDGSTVPPNAISIPANPIAVPSGYSGGLGNDINDYGIVVGTCWPYNTNTNRTLGDVVNHDQAAFVYDGTTSVDLNTLTVLHGAGWHFLTAQCINLHGQIAGWGLLHGKQTSYLLSIR